MNNISHTNELHLANNEKENKDKTISKRKIIRTNKRLYARISLKRNIFLGLKLPVYDHSTKQNTTSTIKGKMLA